MRLASILAAALLSGALASPASALMQIYIYEYEGSQGSYGVAVSYFGSLNVNGYATKTEGASNSPFAVGLVTPSTPSVYALFSSTFDVYGFSDALSANWYGFGSGSGKLSVDAYGDDFGFALDTDADTTIVAVPTGYTSGAYLSGWIRFASETFASLGINDLISGDSLADSTSGSLSDLGFTYALPNDSISLGFTAPLAETPLPAAAPLLGAALAGLGLLARRRRG